MNHEPERHHRRSLRLKGYDYAQAGPYFITVCTHRHECPFEGLAGDKKRLNRYGEIAREAWDDLPRHYGGVGTDAFVVMPNHVHGIIVITGERPVIVGAASPCPTGAETTTGAETAPLRAEKRPTLGRILVTNTSSATRLPSTASAGTSSTTRHAGVWGKRFVGATRRVAPPNGRGNRAPTGRETADAGTDSGVFQIPVHETHQRTARNARCACLAAQLLRTHHPRRVIAGERQTNEVLRALHACPAPTGLTRSRTLPMLSRGRSVPLRRPGTASMRR